MKFGFVLFASVLSLTAQVAKIDPKSVPGGEAKVTDRQLTEAETLKFQLLSAKLQLLADRYKIADYQQEAAPLNGEQQTLFASACTSVGVPADKVQAECALDVGLDQAGKPRLGPDQKPVQPHVWWVKPKATTEDAAKK